MLGWGIGNLILASFPTALLADEVWAVDFPQEFGKKNGHRRSAHCAMPQFLELQWNLHYSPAL